MWQIFATADGNILGAKKLAKVAVIGAGPSGLTALRGLKKLGISYVCFEASNALGGLWNIKNPKSSVYENTYTITSKAVTAFLDFPMPPKWPEYLHRSLVLEYLQQYATRYGLEESIQYNSEVKSISAMSGNGFQVVLTSGTEYQFDYVIIANGHNWYPRLPVIPGKFEGEVLHSVNYNNALSLKNKRILVVGAGNTGCDIAVECAGVSDSVDISMRRGYYFFPKYIFGKPADQFGKKASSIKIPRFIMQRIYKGILWAAIGRIERYGLPKPDHDLLESPAIVNSLFPYYCGHGRVGVKADIKGYRGRTILFKDGSSDEYDVVIYATGYQIYMPFLDPSDIGWTGESTDRPELFLQAFPKTRKDLFIVGLTDGTGGHFPTAQRQARVIANFIMAQELGADCADEFWLKVKSSTKDFSGGIKFLDTPRNFTQFHLEEFTNELDYLHKWFSSELKN